MVFRAGHCSFHFIARPVSAQGCSMFIALRSALNSAPRANRTAAPQLRTLRPPELLDERCLLSSTPWSLDPTPSVPVVVVGAAAGAAPRVTVLDAATGAQRFSFLAYAEGFRGGVRVAVGDVNGDGTQDIITAAGAGGGPHVRIFSGVDGASLGGFFAYGASFSGGVFVAAGDVNGDGRADIITGAGAGGGPHVRVFSGVDYSELMNYFAYTPQFTGGIFVASSDVNNDGCADIVTGAGAGGGPHVRVISGANQTELCSFFAYASSFRGGVFVASGDVNGDGHAEIVTSAGPGGGPHVNVIDGATGDPLGSFFAFDGNYTGGALVAVDNGQVFAGGNPGGAPLARSFTPAGTMLHAFSSLGDNYRQGMYLAAGSMSLFQAIDPDDVYEDNDALPQAADLGAPDAPRTVENLHLLDTADWFHFRLARAGGVDSTVRINFQHNAGDLDLGLYNPSGTLVRRSDGVANSEQISLDGLGAGEYYIKVYGYQGAHNSDYTLTIEPGATSAALTGGANALYVNFEGATITAADLARWGGNQWNPAWLPGGAANGVTVNRFFASRSDREQIISGILSRLQADLTPFGITVRRHTGLAVENVGATTLFAGRSTLTHPHVACDVDFGNNNRTDIAFVGEENWGNAADTILALSDVFLHEAGHTFGLFHVQVVQNGTLYPESMGLRYSSDQSLWLRDTSFMDRTFIEFRDADGNWHGPGGGQPQNSYQVMRGNFGSGNGGATGNLATVDSSRDGTLVITTSAAADQVSIVQLGSGIVNITVNDQHYTVSGLQQLIIDTGGDTRDQIQSTGALGFRLVVGAASDSKLDVNQASLWNGTAFSPNAGGAGCNCPLCQSALDGALAGPTSDLELAISEQSLASGANEGEDTSRADQSDVAITLTPNKVPLATALPPRSGAASKAPTNMYGVRTAADVLFSLDELELLLSEALRLL